MNWWNNFFEWFYSNDGRYVVSGIVLPAVAIIVAGLLGAWIARGSVKRLLAKHDRELKVAAIASLIDAAEQASVWNSLTPQEQVLSDRAVGQADIQVRLLPIRGSDVAANWASHSLAIMRRNSATFGYQVEPAVVEFRDRLVEWQARPGRSRRTFQADLERWSVEEDDHERLLAKQQDDWVAQQHHQQFAQPAAQPAQSAQAATPTPAQAVQSPQHVEPLPTEALDSEEIARLETQRVLDNVSAVERHREASGTDDDSVPPPVHAFPPRRTQDGE